MIASLCWLSEFLLESSGAAFAYHKRLWLLFSLLGFRAASDICLSVIRMAFGKPAYGISSWISLAGQYLLLCWLACQIIRELVDERDRKLASYAGLLSALGGIVAVMVFDRGEGLAAKLLDAEIAAGCFLMLLVAVAWWTRKAELSGPWPKIAIGWLISVFWNVLCAFVWTFWAGAPKFMPVGAIAALAVWNWAAWKQVKNEQKLFDLEFRGEPNQERKPIQSVGVYREYSREWVN